MMVFILSDGLTKFSASGMLKRIVIAITVLNINGEAHLSGMTFKSIKTMVIR